MFSPASYLKDIFSDRIFLADSIYLSIFWVQFSSVQLLSHVWLFATPWIAACQASLFITNSRSSLRLRSIESVMPSSHLIFCCPLLLLPPIPPSIRVFSNESTLRMLYCSMQCLLRNLLMAFWGFLCRQLVFFFLLWLSFKFFLCQELLTVLS